MRPHAPASSLPVKAAKATTAQHGAKERAAKLDAKGRSIVGKHVPIPAKASPLPPPPPPPPTPPPTPAFTGVTGSDVAQYNKLKDIYCAKSKTSSECTLYTKLAQRHGGEAHRNTQTLNKLHKVGVVGKEETAKDILNLIPG